MRNKLVVWPLVMAMLISIVCSAAVPPTPVSAAAETNLSLGKAVTASGQSQTYGPANVIDGNQGSYWESTNHAFPQWIQIDLGADTSINRVVLKLPATWESRTQTLTVQGSSNGSTFSNLADSADYEFNPSTSGNSVTIRFDEASTRYVRLTVTSNTTWPAAQLSEFEIYGPSVSPPTPPTGNNIASGKPITASSSTFTYTATQANDNDIQTYWEGGSNPSTLTLDLGTNHDITSIVLKLNPSPAWSTRTQTIQVLGHDQSTTNFSNLVSTQSYTFNPASGNFVTIPVTATVKRLQLNITSNTGAPAGQIAEFEVYGTAAQNPDLTITDMSWTPSSPIENDDITLRATVKTLGPWKPGLRRSIIT